ncbi:TPA: hypothetical protein IAA68_07425 [Candidatus Galligastranaerophilus faecipullorum]|nr:hypothetical protein [Candidatus Galligastranaerophilus faecipullorum]
MNNDDVKQRLYNTLNMLEYLENSLSAILNTPGCSCEHYVLEKTRCELRESVGLLKLS